MKIVGHRSNVLRACAAAAVVAISGSAANADLVIEFNGVNLMYDGSAIYDAGSTAGGVANPAFADPLLSMDFIVNGSLVGSLNNDISLDLFIPDVTNIPALTNGVHNVTTPGNPGYFDLLIGTSPLASEFLLLDIGSVSITYIDIAGVAQFTFGATISPTYAQNLPFGLSFFGPITVSFSTQIDPGSLTTNGNFITGFTAYGTGEVSGEIPTPAVAMVFAVAGLLAPAARRRRA